MTFRLLSSKSLLPRTLRCPLGPVRSAYIRIGWEVSHSTLLNNSILEIFPPDSQALAQRISPLGYHEEYDSPSLSSPQDFSPEYSPSVPPLLAPLSLSPLAGAFREVSVDDSSPYSINQPLSATSEEFLSAWQHESPLLSSDFPKEVNVEGLSLGSDPDVFPASPLSAFHPNFFEGSFQLGLHFDGQIVGVDDEQLATDDHADYLYTSNIFSPAPRYASSDSLFPLPDRPICNRRHSHSHDADSTAVDCLRRIHSAADITADNPDLYSPVWHPDVVFGDHEVLQHTRSEPPPPPLPLDPSPISDEGGELDHIPRAKIASDAVLRAAAKRRRKKASFECYMCGNCLTSKDNLNSE